MPPDGCMPSTGEPFGGCASHDSYCSSAAAAANAHHQQQQQLPHGSFPTHSLFSCPSHLTDSIYLSGKGATLAAVAADHTFHDAQAATKDDMESHPCQSGPPSTPCFSPLPLPTSSSSSSPTTSSISSIFAFGSIHAGAQQQQAPPEGCLNTRVPLVNQLFSW
jgi:hypothetical protein